MLNKKIKRITSLCIALIMCVAGIVSANATEATPSAEEVFPAEQVKQLQEEAANQPLYNDKDENGNMTLNLTRSTGTYPTRKGTILVTDDWYKGLLPTGHAAIVYNSKNVVESVAEGVILGNNDWYNTRTTCTGVNVNGTTTAQDSAAADWCYKQIGKKYNYNYFNIDTREKFYCSQLVWASFMDLYGIDLNTDAFDTVLGNPVHPAELVNSSNTNTIYTK